jgi:hypothetical protein
LAVFYNHHAKHGSFAWGSLVRELPGRTPAMMQQLYKKHQSYLSLPNTNQSSFVQRAASQADIASLVNSDSDDDHLPAHSASPVSGIGANLMALATATSSNPGNGFHHSSSSSSSSPTLRLSGGGTLLSELLAKPQPVLGGGAAFPGELNSFNHISSASSLSAGPRLGALRSSLSSASSSSSSSSSSLAGPSNAHNNNHAAGSEAIDAIDALRSMAEMAFHSDHVVPVASVPEAKVKKAAKRKAPSRAPSMRTRVQPARKRRATRPFSHHGEEEEPVAQVAHMHRPRTNSKKLERYMRQVNAMLAQREEPEELRRGPFEGTGGAGNLRQAMQARMTHLYGLHPEYSSSSPEDYAEVSQAVETALSSRRCRRWCMHEWYYGAVDSAYFARNDFVQCLNALQLSDVRVATRKEWGVIRNMIGKPRRFSKKFLNEERGKLEQYRRAVRCFQMGQPVQSELLVDASECPAPVGNGEAVTFVGTDSHRELRFGIVVDGSLRVSALSGNMPAIHYKIRPVGEDGMVEVPDVDVMPHMPLHALDSGFLGARGLSAPVSAFASASAAPYHQSREQQTSFLRSPTHDNRGNEFKALVGEFPTTAEDQANIGLLLQLMDRRQALLNHLKLMNEHAARYLTAKMETGSTLEELTGPNTPSQFSQEFMSQYGWTLIQIDKTTAVVQRVMEELRVRRARHKRSLNPVELQVRTVTPSSLEVFTKAEAMAQHLVKLQLVEDSNVRARPSKLLQEQSQPIRSLIESCLSLTIVLKYGIESGSLPPHVEHILERFRVRESSPLKPQHNTSEERESILAIINAVRQSLVAAADKRKQAAVIV